MKKFLILSMLIFTFCAEDEPDDTTIEITEEIEMTYDKTYSCLLYTSPSPRDRG